MLQRFAGDDAVARAALHAVDATQWQRGETVEVRALSDYEVAL